MIQFFLETKSLENTCLRIRFLPYSPSFWPGKPFLCPEINHSPGLQVSTIQSYVHFTDTQAVPSKSVILCVMSSMIWMMKRVSIGTKLRHTLKPPMSLKLLGIYTNPMPQHQGGQVTDLHRYKLIQDLLPALTPSELALPLEERCLWDPLKFCNSKEVLIIQKSEVTFFVPRNRSSKSRRNHYGTGPPRCRSIHYQEEGNSLF